MIRTLAFAGLSAAIIGLAVTPSRSADLATTLQTMGSFDRFIDAAQSVGLFDEQAGGFRERENLRTGEKAYFGVPAQYLGQYLFSCGVLNRNVPEAVLEHYAESE